MKLIVSHPTSNEFNRAAISAMQNSNLLYQFHTSIASFPSNIFGLIGQHPLFAELQRRAFDPTLRPFTFISPWKELGRQFMNKVGQKRWVRHEHGYFSVDAVYQSLDKRVAKKYLENRGNIQGIYAYEDGALYSFKRAKALSIACLYDLPIGYWRTAHRLLEAEIQRWPDWSTTLTGLKDSDAKLARKDEELALADRIFVASSFTASSLQDYPGLLAPVEVIPYGFPEVGELRAYSSSKKLKLLFVGGLSQRKGIADVFAVVDQLKEYVELTIVGRKPTEDCQALNEALSRHRWIPSLPHEEILRLMRTQDVLLFPSLFEGFGLVITEAMSQGTPVITTERTAGPDLIRHGEDGWLIEAGSTDTLQVQVEDILRVPQSIAKVGKAARESARLRPWRVYGQELAAAVSRVLEK